MKDEGQTFEELVAQARALDEGIDHPEFWPIVELLAARGDQSTLDKTLDLAHGDAFERSFAADVLGRLGGPDCFASAEIISSLLEMQEVETDEKVLSSIVAALTRQQKDEQIPAALKRLVSHPYWEVRWHVALGLDGYPTPEAVEMLIALTSDEDVRVRDWATFVLGKQESLDSPEIRAAFVARLDDEDLQTRVEAFYALAERKDARVVQAVLNELDEEAHSAPFDSLTDSLDYRLLPALYEMQKDPEYLGDARELQAAIAKCEAHLERYDHED